MGPIQHPLSFGTYDLSQMTPPVSPIPPRVQNPPHLLADFSAACSLISSNLSPWEGESQQQQRRDHGVSLTRPPDNHGVALAKSSSTASTDLTLFPSPIPSSSSHIDNPPTTYRNDGRSYKSSSQRTTPFQSRVVGLNSPSDEAYKFCPPPSHGATQRSRSKTVSGIPVTSLLSAKNFGNLGAVVMPKNTDTNLPDTPAPTPPPAITNNNNAVQYSTQTYSAQQRHCFAQSAQPQSKIPSSVLLQQQLELESKKNYSPTQKVKAVTPPPKVARRSVGMSPISKPLSIKQAEASMGVFLGTSPAPPAPQQTSESVSSSSPRSKPAKPSKPETLARTAYKHLIHIDHQYQASEPAANRPVHVFLDMSNVIIGYYDACKKALGRSQSEPLTPLPRFRFKAMNKVLLRDRKLVTKREAVGSYSKGKTVPSYLEDAEKSSYTLSVLDRVAVSTEARGSRANRAREQCVDELLHLKMAQSVLDEQEPGVMILATGDANTAQFSDGFQKAVERALNHGWIVELVSWKDTMSQAWLNKSWRAKWGARFRIIELDPFFEYMVDDDYAKEHNLRSSNPGGPSTSSTA